MAKKRGHGDGSIYWSDTRQRWVAEVTVGDGKRQAHMTKTKREAQEWLNKARLAAQEGTLATGPRQTVEQFLTHWLKDTASTRVRPSTYSRYCTLMRLHAIPAFGKVLVSKLTPQHLQRLYADRLTEGLAPATVVQVHRILHRAFEDAVRWDLVARNPCDLVDAPRIPRHELQILNEEQVCRLLQAAREAPLECLYVLALTTGMRQGELLALKWEDIDADGCRLQVRRNVQWLSGKGFIFGEPKTAKGRRQIVLGPLAILALNRHRERQATQKAFAGDKWEESGLVFTNAIGGVLDATHVVRRSFRPLLTAAKLPQIRFHDMRHSAATMLLVQGTHPKVVQQMLGHAAISVTMDTYSHVLPGLEEDAVNRLNARLEATSDAIAKKIADQIADSPREEAAGGQ